MTFPKRGTRKITIAGETYLWRLCKAFTIRDCWLVIGKQGELGQPLYLDPYHHDLLIGPATVRRAIEFAYTVGWTPVARRPPMKLDYNGDDFDGPPFTVLPHDAKPNDRRRIATYCAEQQSAR